MDYLHLFVDVFLHLDKHLNEWAGRLGAGLYILLFTIIFCETGLVVMPFLPGDSLLFAVGALSATEGSPINVVVVSAILMIAAVVGDAVNYQIGKRLGAKAFSSKSRFLKQEHLQKTQKFYDKHGGKTIIIARFMPIIRTFAPFVAGVGGMPYRRFFMFNVIGGVAWVNVFLIGGYLFGNIEVVQKNFTIVVMAIIVISVMPVVIEFIKSKRSGGAPATE